MSEAVTLVESLPDCDKIIDIRLLDDNSVKIEYITTYKEIVSVRVKNGVLLSAQ